MRRELTPPAGVAEEIERHRLRIDDTMLVVARTSPMPARDKRRCAALAVNTMLELLGDCIENSAMLARRYNDGADVAMENQKSQTAEFLASTGQAILSNGDYNACRLAAAIWPICDYLGPDGSGLIFGRRCNRYRIRCFLLAVLTDDELQQNELISESLGCSLIEAIETEGIPQPDLSTPPPPN